MATTEKLYFRGEALFTNATAKSGDIVRGTSLSGGCSPEIKTIVPDSGTDNDPAQRKAVKIRPSSSDGGAVTHGYSATLCVIDTSASGKCLRDIAQAAERLCGKVGELRVGDYVLYRKAHCDSVSLASEIPGGNGSGYDVAVKFTCIEGNGMRFLDHELRNGNFTAVLSADDWVAIGDGAREVVLDTASSLPARCLKFSGHATALTNGVYQDIDTPVGTPDPNCYFKLSADVWLESMDPSQKQADIRVCMNDTAYDVVRVYSDAAPQRVMYCINSTDVYDGSGDNVLRPQIVNSTDTSGFIFRVANVKLEEVAGNEI